MAQSLEEKKVSENKKREIRILCFGDSLTRVYLKGGSLHIQYSDTLKSLLDEHLKNSQFSFKIVESGQDGERK